MVEEKQQPQKQPEDITPLEQKEAPNVTPEIGTEQFHEYRDKTKEAGKKSTESAKTKLNRLENISLTAHE